MSRLQRRRDHPPTPETDQIRTTLKALMNKQRLPYRSLAQHLGVSLPTVKRMLSRGDLSLDRLLQVCSWLEITLADLIELSQMSKTRHFRFSQKHEEFFAAHPTYLAYLFALKEHRCSPALVEKKHGLSRSSTRRYLQQLEKMGLIERIHEDRVRVRTDGSIGWDDHGTLGRRFSRDIIETFSRHAWQKLSKPDKMFVSLSSLQLRAQDYRDLKSAIEELVTRYREKSLHNRKLFADDQTELFSLMVIADAWEAKIFSEITNV